MTSTASHEFTFPRAPQSWLGSCLEVLLPSQCLVCGRPVQNTDLCFRCRPVLPELANMIPTRCVRCFSALPGSSTNTPWCEPCTLFPPIPDAVRFLWEYDGLARDLIRAMKYRPSVSLARLGGQLLRDATPLLFPHTSWDIIIPIPSSHALFRRRFFHPCLELALPTSTRYNLPIRNVLTHRAKRQPQASLSHEARLANLKKLFRVKAPDALRNKSVLMIEDVITTGATTAAAAYQLRVCGAVRVDVIALARTHVWTRFSARLNRLLR